MNDTFYCHGCNRRRAVETRAPQSPHSKRPACTTCAAKCIAARAVEEPGLRKVYKRPAKRRNAGYTNPRSNAYLANTGE